VDILFCHECRGMVFNFFSPAAFNYTYSVYRGFDAQVNGAVLSVPQFRADFGSALSQNINST
jgi:hypothetical protein